LPEILISVVVPTYNYAASLPLVRATLRKVVTADPQVEMVLWAHVSVYVSGHQRLRLPMPAHGSVQ
jgi:Na+-transporting methylmalonyl-CoA/oxaloacetate decarboxylase beta subunit